MVRAMGLFSILGERGLALHQSSLGAAILIGAALILIVWNRRPD